MPSFHIVNARSVDTVAFTAHAKLAFDGSIRMNGIEMG